LAGRYVLDEFSTISLRIRFMFSASWLGRNGLLNNLRLMVFKVLGLPQLRFGSGLCCVSSVSNRFN
ncbi:hypothetical protein, partial [Vibrio anguillarum]|uniref:hypothetical protein n=1 Tax=Vibrio anguillarum TaxID=55601 RepID=UPI001BE3F817